MAEIKNLKKAAQRIKKAIEDKERIILYGDADLDGVSSIVVLKEAIKNLGGEIFTVYFPDREKEGYGITKAGLNFLKKFSPALLIALDLGIGNFEEVKLAKKLGFDIIIIDHHEILGKLPKADIVVDPKQKRDKYPFKNLATVGIVFKLAEILLKEKMTESLRRNFLELVSLGTLADMMPREGENEIFIEEGLQSLENSFRPGILAFSEVLDSEISTREKVSRMISILNIRESEKTAPASFKLFTISSLEEAKSLVLNLIERKEIRKEMIRKALEEIEKKKLNQKIIFEGSQDWDFSILGTLASRLSRKYQKPTFVFKKLEKESVGAVRVPPGINSVELLRKCERYLLTYGGHPPASGFRIKNENLEKFKICLIENLK
jgi:single-stranded-DNA-specific exonuclease